jgi:dTDP-4-amino-4,6-dideoxygalactose transaminase
MNDEFLPFAKPHLSQAAIAEVMSCLQSGWITTGPRVQQFETLLKDYLQAPYVQALANATAGLELALRGLKLQAGDEVITTPYTFVATLNAIVQAGAKPVLVDIEPHTRNIDVNKLAAAITKRTRVIMPVHFAGLSVDLDPIYALAKQYKLRVIEDAAHAIGSYYKGKIIGSFGDIQVFSFHPNKNMTTGEGGCVATRDPELADFIMRMRFHGIDRKDAWNRFSKSGSQYYDVPEPGFKYNMMDIQAALGLHQLPELNNFIERRTELVSRYQTALQDWPEWQLPQLPAYEHKHAWHLYNPLLTSHAKLSRDEFIAEMKQANIGVGFHWQAAHLFSYYQNTYGFKPGDFPVAEDTAERIVSLPLFPTMTDADQERVINTMATIFNRRA